MLDVLRIFSVNFLKENFQGNSDFGHFLKTPILQKMAGLNCFQNLKWLFYILKWKSGIWKTLSFREVFATKEIRILYSIIFVWAFSGKKFSLKFPFWREKCFRFLLVIGTVIPHKCEILFDTKWYSDSKNVIRVHRQILLVALRKFKQIN